MDLTAGDIGGIFDSSDTSAISPYFSGPIGVSASSIASRTFGDSEPSVSFGATRYKLSQEIYVSFG